MSDLIVPPIPPDLRTLLDNLKADIFYNLNCHQVGVIESFDSTKQTASIRLSTLRVVGNEEIPYPLLTDCPVVFPSGGGAYMTFPVTKGDSCLVLFSDRDIDNWFTTGNVVAPNSSRAHSLSDGIALVGIRNLVNPKPYPTVLSPNEVAIWNGGSVFVIGPSGPISSFHSSGSSVQVGNKLFLSANARTLKALMDGLCDVLTNFRDTAGNTPNSATLVAIAAIKAEFNYLLTSSPPS